MALYRQFVRLCRLDSGPGSNSHGDVAADVERCITYWHRLRKVDSHGPSSFFMLRQRSFHLNHKWT